MTTRTITTESKDGLRVITRELIGKDRITHALILNAIVDALLPRYGVDTVGDLKNVVWATATDVTDIILQTVSLEETGAGRWPENLVLPDHGDYPACLAFYDALMDSPTRYQTLLLKGVTDVNADPSPLEETGDRGAKTSQPAPVFAFSTTPVN